VPSTALQFWQTGRMPRLDQIDAQCAAAVALVPSNPSHVDESLRGYVVLLSAHFQGFCRDLYTEAAQVVVVRVRRSLQSLIQDQFTAHRRLDHGNPSLSSLRQDFDRFGFSLGAALDADPANAPRTQHLAALNAWRNVAAHQSPILPPGGPLTLPIVRAWRTSCGGLATALDDIMYNQMRRLIRRPPW
jgi:hypothetical protein